MKKNYVLFLLIGVMAIFLLDSCTASNRKYTGKCKGWHKSMWLKKVD